MDRLDVCAERIALVLGPDGFLAIARYVGKPAATWAGDHAANLLPRSYRGYHFERRRFLLVYISFGRADFMPASSNRSL